MKKCIAATLSVISIKSTIIIVGGHDKIKNKERGGSMIYVGIDIAKLNHFAAILSSDSEVRFTNDLDGFCRLLSVLNSYKKNSLVISLESMAHYGNSLIEFLFPNITISV